MISLLQPMFILLLIPATIYSSYIFLKKRNWFYTVSRLVIITMLIVAMAQPVMTIEHTPQSNNPDVTLILDKSNSMSIMDKSNQDKLKQYLDKHANLDIMEITGNVSNIATMVKRAPSQNIVIYSDGQINNGDDLKETLGNIENKNVYAILPSVEKSDNQVSISGDDYAYINSPYTFDINVNNTNNGNLPTGCWVNGNNFEKTYVELSNKDNKHATGNMTCIFNESGHQYIETYIATQSEEDDYIQTNNKYYKSINVIPKPSIVIIGSENESIPLNQLSNTLYDVTYLDDISNIEETHDIVLLNNVHSNDLSKNEMETLEHFVKNGNGLFVIGGLNSFNYGNYHDSDLENMLPVISKPSDWKGGKNIVMLIDISLSIMQGNGMGGRILDDIMSNAMGIIKSDYARDSNLAVISFGNSGNDISNGFVNMRNIQMRNELINKIESLEPSGMDSSLDEGLLTAQNMLTENDTPDGKKEIIIISDGGIHSVKHHTGPYTRSIPVMQEITKKDVDVSFIHIYHNNIKGQKDMATGEFYAEELMYSNGQKYRRLLPGYIIDLVSDTTTQNDNPDQKDEEQQTGYSLITYNPNHFISNSISPSCEITGFNDVTPKTGSDKIYVTDSGNPVLTTWRYGLGRVATLTTDDGNGNGYKWGSQIYDKSGDDIIQRTISWCMADPNDDKSNTYEYDDTFVNIPTTFTLYTSSNDEPSVSFDEKPITVNKINNEQYMGTICSAESGIHTISGNYIAINYPSEFKNIGINTNYVSNIRQNDGTVYDIDEFEHNLIGHINTHQQPDHTPIPLRSYLIIGALIMLLLDVCRRQIKKSN